MIISSTVEVIPYPFSFSTVSFRLRAELFVYRQLAPISAYAIVHTLSVLLQIIDRLDRARNRVLAVPENAVTIEHKHLDLHQHVDVGLIESPPKQLNGKVHRWVQ